MKRRGYLASILGVLGLGGGGYWYAGGNVEDLKDLVGMDSTPYKEDFGPFTPGFDRIQWVNLDVLEIHFETDHNMDGFGLMHAHDDSYEDALVLAEAPNYDGPVHVRLIQHIKNSGRQYPSRRFKLVAYRGTFGGVSIIQEKKGSVEFTIPKGIWPQSD